APRIDDVRAAVKIDMEQPALADDGHGADAIADFNFEGHRSASMRPASRQRLAAGTAGSCVAGLVNRCTATAIAARSSCAASIDCSGALPNLRSMKLVSNRAARK